MSDAHNTAPEIAPCKLLIGIPGFNGIVPEAQHAMLGMVYHCGKTLPQVTLAVEVVTKKEQFRARNALVDAAIGGHFDWLLMLDDDMVPPHDLIPRLLAHNRDICGALYYQRGGHYHPVLLTRTVLETGEMRTTFLAPTDSRITQPGLHPVDIIGGGCMLFKVDCFRKLMPPYFEYERVLGTDINICSRFLDAGLQPYVDTTLELGHVRDAREIITSRTIPVYERVMAGVNQQLWQDALAYTGLSEEELRSAMLQASMPGAHRAAWDAHPRDTDAACAAYYQEYADWHVHNLLYYNLHHREATKEWVLLHAQQVLTPGATVIDYGLGLGHLALPLAAQGYRLVGVDVADAATLPFVRARLARHHLEMMLLEMPQGEAPAADLPQPAALAYCISALEHLTDPWGVLRWLHRNVQPGGLLVCPYNCAHKDDEPQHLLRYDVTTFAREMRALGWDESPEEPFLFLRR